ncbi:MAG: hypothetical protein AAF480_04650 [Actinomycetota bacterium]
MRKVIASTTIAASMLGAGFGAAALGPAIAGAQDADEAEVTDAPAPGSRLDEVLDGLVADGTLTQAQRDTVEERLREARPERHGHRGGFGRLGGGGEILEGLGLDSETVREGLADGLSLGEIADANGSSADALADALVEQAESRIDEAIEAGRIDDERAAELRTRIEERVDDIVSGEADFGRRGFKGRFGGPRG